MFSWNTASTDSTAAAPVTNRRRPTAGSMTMVTPAVTAIQGSIRPAAPTSSLTTSSTAAARGFTRQQHLESYLQDEVLQRSTRRVAAADDTMYDTVFQTVRGETLIVRVQIPAATSPTAPLLQPPIMTLAGVRAQHAWLDSSSPAHSMRITGYLPISSPQAWQEARILLGAAVKEVVTHLQVYPPVLLEVVDASLAAIQKLTAPSSRSPATTPPRPQQLQHSMTSSTSPTKTTSSSLSQQAPPDYETLLRVPQVTLPTLPRHIDELDDKSREELEDLQDDELKLMAFCNQLPVARELQTLALSVIEDNARQAQKNLDQGEASLKELFSKAHILQKQLQEGVEAFRVLEKRQLQLAAPPDQKNNKEVVRALTKAKKEAMEESDRVAEQWLVQRDAASVAQFCQEFLALRKIHHVRAAKLELWQRR